jgi:hypothetical protein
VNSQVLHIVLFFLFIIGTSECPIMASEKQYRQMVNCSIHCGSCTQSFFGCEVTLDITPKPVEAMKDLTFTVTLEGRQPSAPPFINLRMPGMHMGPNQVALKPVSAGVYVGKGIIVRCPSGKRIWKAVVTIPGIGKVDFIFDVVY